MGLTEQKNKKKMKQIQPIKKPVRTLNFHGVCEGCKGDFFQKHT
jgi:hypothetical protein